VGAHAAEGQATDVLADPREEDELHAVALLVTIDEAQQAIVDLHKSVSCSSNMALIVDRQRDKQTRHTLSLLRCRINSSKPPEPLASQCSLALSAYVNEHLEMSDPTSIHHFHPPVSAGPIVAHVADRRSNLGSRNISHLPLKLPDRVESPSQITSHKNHCV
jgi:hypothetical protein